jgi:hypothetical protein
MLDSDLASLYDVTTGVLNRAVKRDIDRFPEDFCFQLTDEELEALRFQIGISNQGRGGRRYLPYVFTEQGVAMLASVLSSPRAVQVSIGIVRVFVKLRAILSAHTELGRRAEVREARHRAPLRLRGHPRAHGAGAGPAEAPYRLQRGQQTGRGRAAIATLGAVHPCPRRPRATRTKLSTLLGHPAPKGEKCTLRAVVAIDGTLRPGVPKTFVHAGSILRVERCLETRLEITVSEAP